MICKSRLFFTAFFALLALFFCLATPAAQANPLYASIVVDASTGEVLHESNSEKVLFPASLTKVMTLYLLFEKLDRGEWNYGTQLYVSKRASMQEPTNLSLREGDRIRVIDAIKALVVRSANDVAVVVAEGHSGTEAEFARQMTAKARQLGMTKTVFKNASGLPDRNQVSSARDMATLAVATMRSFPHYYHFFSTVSFTYAGRTYTSHNRLMNSYRGMDGMKTGFIRASGFNLISSAVRDNRRLVGVVFGGRTADTRNQHMASLMDRAFGNRVSPNNNRARVNVAGLPPVPSRKPDAGQVVAALDSSLGVGDENRVETVVGQGSTDRAIRRPQPSGQQQAAARYNFGGVEQVALQAARPGQAATQLQNNASWSIQVGAFDSRVRSEKALRAAISAVPDLLAGAFTRTVPVQSDNGRVLFRARLSGLDREAAYAACSRLRDCVIISP